MKPKRYTFPTIPFAGLPAFLLCIFIFASCQSKTVVENEVGEAWQDLFNGIDLEGWDTYLGPRYDSGKGDFAGEHVGLNQDPRNVFSVVEEDGEKAIRISGEEFGGISTIDDFENYHLSIQFKWGKKKSPPKENANRDSGLLYHAHGPHAMDWFFWMESQEFQIQEGDCGDYWGLGMLVDVPAKLYNDSLYIYDENGPLFTFGSGSTNGRNVKKFPDAEKPTGEWNTIELYALGDTSYHVVNGIITMKLYKSRKAKDGKEDGPLSRGKIQIQSEGAEIFYRNIKIRPIKKLPNPNLLTQEYQEAYSKSHINLPCHPGINLNY